MLSLPLFTDMSVENVEMLANILVKFSEKL